MKKRILALAAAGCLLLSGCKAMLERSYSAATPHADHPVTAEDPSVLRVENYRELVSAVLYLVSEGEEEGTIQLHNYDGEEESDLSAACLEVATQDPLGAYAVDYIKHELSRVVSYYQATLAIHYRRSAEQRKSIVSVNGDRAIRDQLQGALEDFSSEAVLRVPYFFGDEETVKTLLREAYYADPALTLPETEVSLYPDSGRERIVELTMTYAEAIETLKEQREELSHQVAGLLPEGEQPSGRAAARWALERLWDVEEAPEGDGPDTLPYDPEGGSTAYDALVERRADGEGMALGYALLCQRLGLNCSVQTGLLEEETRVWDVVELPSGEKLYVDPSLGREWDISSHSQEKFFSLGYFLPET